MEWKLLFLFIAVAAAFEEVSDEPDSYNPVCMDKVFSECHMNFLDPQEDFPETREEFQDVCKQIMDNLNCATDILDECDDSNEQAQFIYITKRVFQNICDENSKLFAVIAQNLKCFQSNLEYFGKPCPLTPDETQEFNDMINALSAADEDAFENADLCKESLTKIGCLASKVEEKCGDRALAALIDILLQLEKPFERCGPGVKANLALIAAILDVEEELAEDLAEMKKKKR